MASNVIRIGTRDSMLAVWQATLVKEQLAAAGHPSELIFVKSEGDIDLVTPLYAIGVQGVFTRTLDAALLSGRIDMAVHSMKDVPVQLAQGIAPAAVLPRASVKDLLVLKAPGMGAGAEGTEAKEGTGAKEETEAKGSAAAFLDNPDSLATIATSSLRRRAQWLHRYPFHQIENLRGNVNTRLKKVAESAWQGAIFAAAGLERIGERPEGSIELDWMLPAPAQGAILVVCRGADAPLQTACASLHDEHTAICVNEEREFLSALMGGCSTPVGALATIKGGTFHFHGNVCSLDGKTCLTEERVVPLEYARGVGRAAAEAMLQKGAADLIQKLQ